MRKAAVPGTASLVIGPFDLNALEVAIQLKERHGGQVTALTLGSDKAKEALRRALAMGANQAVPIDETQVSAKEPSVTTRVWPRPSGSWTPWISSSRGGSQASGTLAKWRLLAEELGMPFVPFVPRLDVAETGCA